MYIYELWAIPLPSWGVHLKEINATCMAYPSPGRNAHTEDYTMSYAASSTEVLEIGFPMSTSPLISTTNILYTHVPIHCSSLAESLVVLPVVLLVGRVTSGGADELSLPAI